MQCPACGSNETAVKDSRPNGVRIRRRRVCECGHRFTTHEMTVPVSVSAHSVAMAISMVAEAQANLATMRAILDDAHEAAVAEGEKR
jgi:hypothetical protein